MLLGSRTSTPNSDVKFEDILVLKRILGSHRIPPRKLVDDMYLVISHYPSMSSDGARRAAEEIMKCGLPFALLVSDTEIFLVTRRITVSDN
jgi:hypothetical protein